MKRLWLVFLLLFLIGACNPKQNRKNPFVTKNPIKASLELVTENEKRWTGICISKEGRMFVCFPRWSPQVPISVGEIESDIVKPFPNKEWNSWSDGETSINKFVCIQSVYIDNENYLWVLDPASPYLQGVVDEGARIYKFNLKDNSLISTYNIPKNVAPSNSYLNDIRIDTDSQTAYITESGLGAIVVVDLKSGRSIRRLANHLSTKAELDSFMVDGISVKAKIHADGIELSLDRMNLYYQSLSGRHLYKVPTKELRDSTIDDRIIESKIEMVNEVGVNDGIICDQFGNIFLTGLESNAINLLNTEGKFIQIVQDKRIQWPDTFTKDSAGNIYFTVAQLHLPPNPNNTYKIFRIRFDN